MTAPLKETARLCADKVLNPSAIQGGKIRSDTPVLILLAAGKGTRFGKHPKCIQPVLGTPLAQHSLAAFRQLSSAPSICIVGYQAEQVSRGLGDGNIFVMTDDPAGGTAMAAMEAFAVDGLAEINPIVVVSMGDRVVPSCVFEQLLQTHTANSEASVTLLTARYQPPGHKGKGRIVRDEHENIERIIEQPDIDLIQSTEQRERFDSQTEGNCPLYAIRAATLQHYLGNVIPANAQGQYYFTDIIEAIRTDGGTIRSMTISPFDEEYPVLCADVTRAEDLPKLESVLSEYKKTSHVVINQSPGSPINAVQSITMHRSGGQAKSIAAQLETLHSMAELEQLGFDPEKPIGIGISGGRLRIAFMHPDMGRFFGPAWQMPIGAGDESGREQIVIVAQASDDDQILLCPVEHGFREQVSSVQAKNQCMYPADDVVDGYTYETFGTAMTRSLLSTLGYYSDEQIASLPADQRPDPARWISNAMRRPFALLANAIASIRTVREGELGKLVTASLGRERFAGLKVVSTGEIPQGGFSSSSAVTVAVINALDALYEFGFYIDRKVQLACQAEYGTGVRAGALDQATELKGRHSVGTLISSNPKDNYDVLGSFPVHSDRYRVLFPYTVDRDQTSWKWSGGVYASEPHALEVQGGQKLTAAEMRKMTGKATELAAILLHLPVDYDLFRDVEQELVETGNLTRQTTRIVRDRLAQIPLRVQRSELQAKLRDQLSWYVRQQQRVDPAYTPLQAETMFQSLLDGWRNPLLRRGTMDGDVADEAGVPLRAMVAYLYAEVSINCRLVHHPDQWIDCVTRSQRGDKCFEINADLLPSKDELLKPQSFEKGVTGADLMQRWLTEFGAQPFDFNRGIQDSDLADDGWCLTRVEGTNFFRGLALIDLAEAMLKRAFGSSAIAVRVNGAGQGDYFQVHVDTTTTDVDEVKDFIRKAFYQRFDLRPEHEFVEPHPGGGAVGVRLSRYGDLPELIEELRLRVAKPR